MGIRDEAKEGGRGARRTIGVPLRSAVFLCCMCMRYEKKMKKGVEANATAEGNDF